MKNNSTVSIMRLLDDLGKNLFANEEAYKKIIDDNPFDLGELETHGMVVGECVVRKNGVGTRITEFTWGAALAILYMEGAELLERKNNARTDKLNTYSGALTGLMAFACAVDSDPLRKICRHLLIAAVGRMEFNDSNAKTTFLLIDKIRFEILFAAVASKANVDVVGTKIRFEAGAPDEVENLFTDAIAYFRQCMEKAEGDTNKYLDFVNNLSKDIAEYTSGHHIKDAEDASSLITPCSLDEDNNLKKKIELKITDGMQVDGNAHEKLEDYAEYFNDEDDCGYTREEEGYEKLERTIGCKEFVDLSNICYMQNPTACHYEDVDKLADKILTSLVTESTDKTVVIRAESQVTAALVVRLALAKIVDMGLMLNAYIASNVTIEQGFGGKYLNTGGKLKQCIFMSKNVSNICVMFPKWLTGTNIAACKDTDISSPVRLRIDVVEKCVSVNKQSDTVIDITEDVDTRKYAFKVKPRQYFVDNLCHVEKSAIDEVSKHIEAGISEYELRDIMVEACKVAVSHSEYNYVINAKAVKQAVKTLGLEDNKKGKFKAVKKLNDTLKDSIKGQDEALGAISRAMKIACTGLNDEEKPVVSMLFVGPTGTGKTETAKQLAKALNRKFVRVDMSEYADQTAVNKINGSSAGYVGYDDGSVFGKLIKDNEDCVLLLDEIEKAHESVFDTLLQILDNGILHDNKGNDINFRKAIIIMTSNSGIQDMGKRGVGFNSAEAVDVRNSKGISECVESALRKSFRAEFLNRIDYIIQFNQISKEVAKQIAVKMMKELSNKLPNKVVVRDKCYDVLADKGVDIKYGAREIKRVINDEIKSAIAEAIVDNEIDSKKTVVVSYSGEHVVVTFKDCAKKTSC